MIDSYDQENDVVTFTCRCTNQFDTDVSGCSCLQEENFPCIALSCTCGDVTYLNMDIPIGYYDEYELEQTVMTADEIAQRRIIRDLMWAKRDDLQLLDRAVVDQESYNKNVLGK